ARAVRGKGPPRTRWTSRGSSPWPIRRSPASSRPFPHRSTSTVPSRWRAPPCNARARGRHVRRVAFWCVVSLWLLLPGVAWARYQIPRVQDAEGLRIGDRTTFHGGVALPIGVDSNVFLETREEDPRAAAFIFPSAWIGIGNR